MLFEIPVLIFFLTLLGIVTARSLLKNLRYAILIIFVVAAVVTPTPDVQTMMVFALPSCVSTCLELQWRGYSERNHW